MKRKDNNNMKLTPAEIIGKLILRGFTPRDTSRDCIDFFHTTIHWKDGAYEWRLRYLPKEKYTQVSDSLGWMPFNKSLTTEEELEEAIQAYEGQVRTDKRYSNFKAKAE